MKEVCDPVRIWENPAPEDLGDDLTGFLRRLGGPTWLVLRGRDRSRCRALATLLHGNETSGLRAVFGWLRSGRRPVVDIVCFIGSVETALAEPRFSQRTLPGRRDLNRCFRPPYEGREGRLARDVVERLAAWGPEALIDLHNTSGIGPPFGVAARPDPRHESLVGLFARRLILTDLRMGAMMELAAPGLAAVTVECGGAQDPASHAVALEGLERFFTLPDLHAPGSSRRIMEIWKNPLRVQLRPPGRIAFGFYPRADADLTLRPDIEHFNSRVLSPEEPLGWLNAAGLDALVVRGPTGTVEASEYFSASNGQLFPKHPLQLSMATAHARIALEDCLFYLVPASA